ncbi:MAG: hypothetical protein WC406_01420 [Methanoregula sp.]
MFNLNPFSMLLSAENLQDLQRRQYRECLIMRDLVPAGGQHDGIIAVSSYGNFLCMAITGRYETLSNPGGAGIVDDGVCYLSGQLRDGSGGRPMFDQRIPFDLLLSPGRRKSALSTTLLADPSAPPLFYPLEFMYLFPANNNIVMDAQNDSDTDLRYEICFHGIRIAQQFQG